MQEHLSKEIVYSLKTFLFVQVLSKMGIQTRAEGVDLMCWAGHSLLGQESENEVLVAKANGVVQLWNTEAR